MKPILQVEDDPNDVFLLQHAWRKAGIENPIQIASDGQQAIHYLQGVGKFADRAKFPYPCLVFLDLKLPYIMGLDVLAWIRRHASPSLTVVMLTASGEDADITASYRLGANAFLTKPSEASKLVDMVSAVKDFWLTHNTVPHVSLPQCSTFEVAGAVRPVSARLLSQPFRRVSAHTKRRAPTGAIKQKALGTQSGLQAN
jgi:CheY-like chemotaxis protein